MRRTLDPIDRNSEVLFGLFMVLTFTGTLSVATAGREDVRTMLIAAIGCNPAWGCVHAVMYVLRSMVARGRKASLVRQVLPFIFMTDLRAAMRVSGAVAMVMLFACGFAWGRYAGGWPWRTGIAMVVAGAIIQAVVIALGG